MARPQQANSAPRSAIPALQILSFSLCLCVFLCMQKVASLFAFECGRRRICWLNLSCALQAKRHGVANICSFLSLFRFSLFSFSYVNMQKSEGVKVGRVIVFVFVCFVLDPAEKGEMSASNYIRSEKSSQIVARSDQIRFFPIA